LTDIRPQIIDSAPGKELFCLIRDERNVVAFQEFYELRKVWCGGYSWCDDELQDVKFSGKFKKWGQKLGPNFFVLIYPEL
jgi:hypothetical protein